jgi:hypothetical protein
MAIRVFSWGFWGWGTSTRQLIAAVDTTERERGFSPPVFVDIRLRRAGRAPGFRGNTFERLVGRKRYRWMPTLGNANVSTGKKARIECPSAVHHLLDLALDSSDDGSRVIFFCACESPYYAPWCHRQIVARLLRDAARRRRLAVQVAEWPGGVPKARVRDLRITPDTLRKVAGGLRAVPLNRGRVPPDLAGIPWGTLVMLRAGAAKLPVAVGPVTYRAGSWVLPRFHIDGTKPPQDTRALRRQAAAFRRELGLD